MRSRLVAPLLVVLLAMNVSATAGECREQVAILNCLLHINLEHGTRKLRNREAQLQRRKEAVPRLEKLAATELSETELLASIHWLVTK